MRSRLRSRPWRGALVAAAPVAAALFALLAPPFAGFPRAGADVVTTKGGKTLEGKVVSQDTEKVVVETTFEGRREVARADVVKVDTTVPPLRDQLAYRFKTATDVKSLEEVASWGKGKGFSTELADVWEKVLTLDPANLRAHKALGHVKVGPAWLTPEEKARADQAAEEAALRAKGLVPYQGRWVTPEEKAALEKGLVRDGDEWVTEEEHHRRRGEKLVDGAWIRVGEKEGVARAAALSKSLEASISALWGPHVDLFHDLSAEEAAACLAAAEKTTAEFHRLMKPAEGDKLEGLRIEVFCCQRVPTYSRYVERFAAEAEVAKIDPSFESWASQASRARSFWWPHPIAACGQYLFPNTLAVLESAVAHNVSQILLVRYRFNVRFSSHWITEGLAYHLEMKALGRSHTYTVGRGGIVGGGDPAPWQDSAQWKAQLKAQVAASSDTPFSRLAQARGDAFSLPDLVKAWSVVDFLVATDAAKFKSFLDMTKRKDTDEFEALRVAYGMDAKQVEERWRASITASAGP